jgi:hypothetical protein
MEQCGKYLLQEPVSQGSTTSYRGRDSATGRDVLVHMLPPQGSADLTVLLRLMGGLSAAASALILDEGQQNGRPYLVTRQVIGFRGLQAWLEELIANPPSDPSFVPVPVAEPKAAQQSPGSGALTLMFRRDEAVAPLAESKPAAPQGPGELTRIFKAEMFQKPELLTPQPPPPPPKIPSVQTVKLPPPVSKPSASPARGRSANTDLIVIVCILLLAVFALIHYLRG